MTGHSRSEDARLWRFAWYAVVVLVIGGASGLRAPSASAASRRGAVASATGGGLQTGSIGGDPTDGRLAASVLRNPPEALTVFQKGLLRADVILSKPAVANGIDRLEAGQLPSKAEVAAIKRAIKELKADPALATLKRRGKALKGHPGVLRAGFEGVLGTLEAQAPISGASGNKTLDSVLQKEGSGGVLSPAWRKSAARRGRHLISGPAGVRRLQRLPPILLAQLAPPPSGLAGPLAGAVAVAQSFDTSCDVAARPHFTRDLDARTTVKRAEDFADLQITEYVLDFWDLPPLPTSRLKEIGWLVTGLSSAFGLPALLGTAAVVATGEQGFVWIDAGGQLAEAIFNWYYGIHPSYISLTPSAATAKPLQSEVYDACALNGNGQVVGVAPLKRLTISGGKPGASLCDQDSCESTELGAHTVTGEAGDGAQGFATLSIEPGDLTEIRLEPDSAQVPATTHQTYTAEAFDNFGHSLGKLGEGTKYGPAQLSISPSGGSTGAECQADWCTARKKGTYAVKAELPGVLSGERAAVSLPATLEVHPKTILNIAPAALGATLPDLNFTKQFEAYGARGQLTWEFEVLQSVENCPNCAFYGFTPGYFKIEPSGLLHGRGLQPGESLEAVVRAWDDDGGEGEELLDLNGSAPPGCATVCLYPGTGEVNYPVPTTFGASFNVALDGGQPVFRYIYDGVNLDPWPTYYPEGWNSFEVKTYGGDKWWVPWMYAWYPRWPELQPGHTLALEVVEEENGDLSERRLATSNTIVLR
jgi:hypothetical protein